MLHYIIQTIAFQLFFLLAYDLFLKKETFFNWNRIYLLATAVLSMVLPFIKIDRFKEVVPPEYIITLPEVILGEINTNSTNVITQNTEVAQQSSLPIFQSVLYLGIAVALACFIFKLARILFFVLKNSKHKSDNITVVNLKNSNAAFSFFNIVFLGENLKTEEKEAILKHELIHIKQKHTLDLLFFEVLRILLWFNPLVYMYQKRIEILHEYIADEKAIKHQDKTHYYQNLLSQVFDTQNISFINPFFKQSLIKKRIVMLTKSKSKQINLLKYALLLPMVLGMLVYTSCVENPSEISKKEESVEIQIENLKYVIENSENLTEEQLKSLSELSFNATKKRGFNNSENYAETESDNVEVPFVVVDQVPVFPGCEDLTNDEQKKCMSTKISTHVSENFNIKLANELGLKGRQRIKVLFKIDTDGNTVGVRSKAPHPTLEAEAVRVIENLPKMIPGEQNEEKVIVTYSLPIIFEVSE